ncbi:diguanylate cyclase [Guyparkeria hydrothermalis]|uniref:GGDEF domain-containing response regulator n=1 Tax=Guyparkeria hydrothermalis TaxID=923 RepID=UPI0020206E55|nr:diguanylate cyclase [Guyparkeria hydrothermalis]MCL7743730.1 diguanylate cyclase [Guyparkeria hydrothermalis]
MPDDALIESDSMDLPQWKGNAADWPMAAASLRSTVDDPTARRPTRLADLQNQVQELIQRARKQKLRVLLGVLNRIDQEIAREHAQGSADLSRLNRLIRYFDRLAQHIERTREETPEAIALYTGSREIPEVLDDSLRRSGFGAHPINLENPDPALLEHTGLLIYLATSGADHERELERLQELRKRMTSCAQSLMISQRDDFGIRAAAVRAGIDHVITHPIDSARLNSLLTGARAYECDDEQITVLLVDDMATAGVYWRKQFAHANVELLFETRPEAAFETALGKEPDVILLDLYMPEMDGVDLARIFREHPRLSDVPILFMSTEERDQHRLEAKLKGGDDFLNKSIAGDDLIRMVRYRAQRYRQARAERRTDSLTGLLNHRAITEMVDSELDRAIRQEQPLSVVMIDIDKFKTINDTYGHPSGDRVIRRLSTLLNTRLRKYDGVGRYGGEEFMVVLPATPVDAAATLIDRLREQFAELEITTESGETLHCHFSAGVACYPDHVTPQEIINAADAALYRAKQAGRNQVQIGHVDEH